MSVSTRSRTGLPAIEGELAQARLQPLADRVLPERAPAGAGDPPPTPRAGLPAEAPDTASPADAAAIASPAMAPHEGATIPTTPTATPVFRKTGNPDAREPPQP